jgi:hypothetical protein
MEYKEGFFNSYVNYFISSFIKSYGNIAFVYFKLHMYTMLFLVPDSCRATVRNDNISADVFDDTIEIE